jgi:hypothetical protein
MASASPVLEAEPQAARDLTEFLRRVRRRVFADRLLRNAALDLFIALSLLAVLVAADRVFFPGTVTLFLAGAFLVAALLVSVVRTLFRTPLDTFHMALLADSRLALKERVSSAVFIARSGGRGDAAGGEWERLIALDAARSLSGADLRRSFPIRAPRLLAWALIPLFLAGSLSLWLPVVDLLGIGARRQASLALKKAVAEEEKKLDEKMEELAKKTEDPEMKKLLAALAKRAQEKPEDPPGSPRQPSEKSAGEPKKEALVELTRREDEIKKGLEGKKFDPLKDAKKAFESLELKDSEATKKLREALKEGDFKKAKQELDQLREEVAALAKKENELTPEDKGRLQKLAKELARLASDSKALSQLGSSLSSASSSLNSREFAESLDRLQMSAEELESLSRLADDADLLDQALELVKLAREDLADLKSCPQCGTPYCQDCGKPQCSCKPGTKPGGT